MSSYINSPLEWTWFSQVFATHCLQCSSNHTSKINSSRRRKTNDDEDINDFSSPPSKIRQLENDIVIAVAGTRRMSLDKQYQVRLPIPQQNCAANLAKQPVDSWILARRWYEPLGVLLEPDLPCGHVVDLQSIPTLSVSYRDGVVNVMLDDDILAMRGDDQQDLTWAELTSRILPRSTSVFSATSIFQSLNQVQVEATIVYGNSSTRHLSFKFDVLLHQNLCCESLVCAAPINTAMQDLVHFLFPPPASPSLPFTSDPIKDLYAHLKPDFTPEPPSSIQPELLNPQLLPFQKRSVAWCLERECYTIKAAGQVEYREPSAEEKLPLSWECIPIPDSRKMYINRPYGLMCLADSDLVSKAPGPRGGILAEEMGLGKTVEMLALILLNRRKLMMPVDPNTTPEEKVGSVLGNIPSTMHLDDSFSVPSDSDIPSEPALIKSAATLIITPQSILHQWESEIEFHAPSLKVFIYTEIAHKQITPTELAKYDIVLTTYSVLSKEVNYTNQYDRPRRYERLYRPRTSPFISIEWWRVCLDEAQMIEGGAVSQATAMALKIPRVMSWAISGTPIRRHVEDLRSLLVFLKEEPLASNKRLWALITNRNFRSTFISSYRRIMHRYAKRDVVKELSLPPQTRLVYGIQFTEIERTNYIEKWEQCLMECDIEGASENSAEAEKLQSWFMRLRQICCHPQIGSRNKDSLGRTNLKTIDEVLDVMIQQNNAQLYMKERALFATKLKRAILSASLNKDVTEMELFTQLEAEANRQVEVWKLKYEEQVTKNQERKSALMNGKGKGLKRESEEIEAEEIFLDILDKAKSSAGDAFGTAIIRHRDWQELYHKVLFFIAGFYHELEIETKETEYYERAEDVRQRILGLQEQSFNKRKTSVMTGVESIPLDASWEVAASEFTGGIIMRRFLEQLELVTTKLNQQLRILIQWRNDLVSRLTQPLMQDGEEGEQYQHSIDLQHTLESYLHHYERMLFLRRDLLLGSQEVMAHHVKAIEKQREHVEMAKRRDNRVRLFKRKSGTNEEPKKDEDLDMRLGNEMNALITPDLVLTLRSVRANIKSVASDITRPQIEREMAEIEDLRLKNEESRQIKLVLNLEREITEFRALTALRTAYYRQLQTISDSVRDLEPSDLETDIADCLDEEKELQTDIIRVISKQRYLDHLAHMNKKERHTESQRLCLICRSEYSLGLITECGHVFCEYCLVEWTKNHFKCPSCNSQISRRKLARVTMNGATPIDVNLDIEAEANASEGSNPNSLHENLPRASQLQIVPDAIRHLSVEDGYGSKIDSIVRHIAYLVREDPGTKCLVFSQWKNLLDIIGESLDRNRIGYVRLDGPSMKTAVKQFKESMDNHVFMLHAKSQSAGLTLLSATHVFICEPLVNPVLQAQAVSRVHRIGQLKESRFHALTYLSTNMLARQEHLHLIN
ncbi:SNF2 family N-terminal domain-domain-containing protein [Lobosporangium transversale]|uniref:SNF2 family N-terminal domain-domain-containing protein n=1 Tax=Lobosporangium transversale TaxID=64571 RepID=A0A1Y2GCX3_9FUNG|nr:SNF2 family N-terminal domain-domain-containing protein [Lobosporangium transversale]ORZ06330.1 SNF2 family N-terminal domain-domain-containing protein [Lobosporangium transversale]|eukprot:XP_021877493.1 SNF2 family N-terminal domain-domain-containing protein [Lobosporangium transversale]